MINEFGIELYEPLEVAKKLGLGKNTIYNLLKSGEMGYIIWGTKEKRITKDQIKDFIARRTVSKNSIKLYQRAV